jgi:hypothetical protein
LTLEKFLNIIKGAEKEIEELKEVLTWCNDIAYCTYLDELNLKERELMELELLELFQSARLNGGV